MNLLDMYSWQELNYFEILQKYIHNFRHHMYLHTSRCQHVLRICHVPSTIIVLFHWYQLCYFSNENLEGEISQTLKANGRIVTSQKLIEYFTSHSHCKSWWLHCWRGKRFQQRRTTSVSLPRLGWGDRKWKCKHRPCPPPVFCSLAFVTSA